MHISSRAVRSFACLLLLSTSTLSPVLAQPGPVQEKPATANPPSTKPIQGTVAPGSASKVPWLYKGSDVPPDLEWNFGELSNGLRYAVRKNGVPPGQVSIRIRVDAGSLYETDSERGYAHLLEHMVFRQSKYLAEGTAIATFQRLGASFGTDTNAETSPTQTVFKLDLPNATPVSLDETFKLLSGMVTAPTLSADNLKLDVPIVMAEMRERGGAAKRVQDTMQDVFYKGQPLAERSPIGTVKSLQTATQDSVRAFYKRWYRPQNVVVIVAGDAEPAQLESYVKKWFADWKPTGQAVPAPSFGDPVAPADAPKGETPIGDTKVLVEPDLPPAISYATLRPWRQVNDTIVYNQGLMTDSLAQAIINRRLESKARLGGSFLTAQVNQQDVSRSTDATFVSITPLGDDWKAAVRDVRAVITDAMTRPPTQAEIDRELAELDVAFQVPVEQRRLLPGSKLADDLVNALDIRETVASPEAVLRIFRESKPLFTPAAVQQHTRQLFSGTVTRGLFITQKAGNATDAALRQALAAPVKPDEQVRQASGPPVSFDKLPPIGQPGQITQSQSTGLLGIQQVVFANGVKALLWPVQEEPGRVTVKARFGGGYREMSPKDAPYIGLGQMALVSSGLATLGQDDLDRISTGRKMGFDFKVDDAAFEMTAETRPADLADQLYLFAAKLDMPRWDKQPFERAKAAAKIQYAQFATSPQGVLNRDLQFYQRGQDLRFETATPAEIDKTTADGFRKVWEKALASGPVEVQIYGDFDPATTLAALQRTFGALKPRDPAPVAAATGDITVPKPSTKPIILAHHGDPDQAAAVISWPTSGGSIGLPESRQLEILTQLFTNRLLDAMREKLGASYAPYVYSTWPVDLKAGGSITAIAQIEPGKVPVFFQTADQIAQDLITNPPSADELARVIEPLRQQITRAASSTQFFMQQLEGATTDASRINSLRTIMTDYTETTPAKMQALAAKYLGKGASWRLEVVPQKDAGKLAKAQ